MFGKQFVNIFAIVKVESFQLCVFLSYKSTHFSQVLVNIGLFSFHLSSLSIHKQSSTISNGIIFFQDNFCCKMVEEARRRSHAALSTMYEMLKCAFAILRIFPFFSFCFCWTFERQCRLKTGEWDRKYPKVELLYYSTINDGRYILSNTNISNRNKREDLIKCTLATLMS